MQHYIGTKQIQARPGNGPDGTEGYRVVYPDGYESWSPKDVFESAYLSMGDGDGSKITQQMVTDVIRETHVHKLGDKTTAVRAVLRNGFEITETSSCVDPANYNEAIGKEVCLNRIHDKVWMLLGFLLQTARNGIA